MKLEGRELLEDILASGKSAVLGASCALAFVGLQYLNDRSVQIPMPTGKTLLFSREMAFAGVSLGYMLGTIYGGVSCAYYTLKVPLKLVTSGYFERQ